MKRILLLGASGSIGQQTLEIIARNPQDFELVAFSVGSHTDKIDQILKQNPHVLSFCIGHAELVKTIQKKYPDRNVYSGDRGLLDLVENVPCDLVVNALVGFVGFAPTVRALEKNIDVALANKESLVVGGDLIRNLLFHNEAHLYPIDSEHVALAKCLQSHDTTEVRRLVLTASGGSFRNLSREKLSEVTVEDALRHPSWSMGKKITIDSATMMNKGFEIIEAHYLFGFSQEKIDVLLHDESKIHSLVEFNDGSFLADIGPADMRIPIAYALYGGSRRCEAISRLNLSDFGDFHFHAFEPKRYPCVGYAREALTRGGTALAILNAANEVAVQAFLEGAISFLKIEAAIAKCLAEIPYLKHPTFSQIVEADRYTRMYCQQLIKENNV